jgi:hypothetical protein
MPLVVKKQKARVYQQIAYEFTLYLKSYRARHGGEDPDLTKQFIRFNQISDTYLKNGH